jgi:CubicO group peptidase (beta-lactamase class C family)
MRISAIVVIMAGLFVHHYGQETKPAGEIGAYVRAFADRGHFYGIVIAKKEGRVVYQKAFGYANLEHKIPNQVDTRVGIASVTKPMTVVVLHRLIGAGKLGYKDKINKFIHDFPNGDKITVEHLAGHRAGIPHRVMPEEFEATTFTSEEMVEKAKQAKLEFEPGERYAYSSGGFIVLARVLEIASGKSYAQLLEEYVFGPAAMKDSLDDPGAGIIERSAQDYFRDENRVYHAPLKDYSFLVGAGSVYSSAGDVMRFGEAVAAGTFGEEVKRTYLREGVITSSGSTNGHRALLKINTNKKYSFVLLSNLGTGAFDLISDGIEAILDDRKPAPPVIPVPASAKLSDEKLQEYIGTYTRDGAGQGFDLRVRRGVLWAGEMRLIPTKPDCFFEFRFYGNVCAVRDTSGKVTSFKWESHGYTSNWIRQ